jgi:hypothetical protein
MIIVSGPVRGGENAVEPSDSPHGRQETEDNPEGTRDKIHPSEHVPDDLLLPIRSHFLIAHSI